MMTHTFAILDARFPAQSSKPIKKNICARLALVKEELDRDGAERTEAPRVKCETAPWGARSFVESSRVHLWVNTVASLFVSLAFLATYY